MKCEIVTGNMPQLWEDLLSQLHEKEYPSESIRHYREAMGRVDRYMRENQILEYTEAVGETYLATHGGRISSGRQFYMSFYVRRLNDILNKRPYVVVHTRKKQKDLKHFSGVFERFDEMLCKQSISDGTRKLQDLYCYEFLHFVEQQGISDLKEINAQILYAAFSASGSKENFRCAVRKLMTEIELNEKITNLLSENPTQQKQSRRPYARENRVKKDDRLLRIIQRYYIPHAGYVDCGFDSTTLLHSGKYIKYPKHSHCQRWMKRLTSKKTRRCTDLVRKGNEYRRLFDYWWTLY